MNHSDIHDDVVLTGLVAAMLDASERVPDDAVAAAYAAVEMDGLQEELAALVFDSAAQDALVAMRSLDLDTRLLSFVNDFLTLDVELHGDGTTIMGQVTPAGVERVDIERFDGLAIPADLDDFGRFRASVPHGPIRLRVVGQLVTPWITR